MSVEAARAVRATAPGTIGNVGPGLDVLGMAVEGVGDAVVARRAQGASIVIEEAGHPELPADPDRNTAGIAARGVLRRAGAPFGVVLRVEKGLPLSGGRGGSAASAVAAAVAVNALLERPLGPADLLGACLDAEAAVSGRHLDNVAPALLGGIVLIRATDPPDLVPLPVPPELRVVLAEPEWRLRTAEARAGLPASLPRDVALHQVAHVAAMVAALAAADYALLGRSIDDRIAEPARSPLLPGFEAAKRAALAAGALGASISGAGPAAFALVRGDASAERVAQAMAEAYREAGIACRAWATTVDTRGARVEPV